MPSIQKYIEYYRACYLEDSRSFRMANAFTGFEKSYFLKNITFENPFDLYIIDENLGEAWEYQIQLHGTDKQLMASFLGIRTSTKVLLPIYLLPINMVYLEGEFLVELDYQNKSVNPQFIQYLSRNYPNVVDKIHKELDEISFFSKQDIAYIFELFEDAFPSSVKNRTDHVLLDRKEIKDKPLNQLVMQLSVGLTRRSSQIRYIIKELDELATEKSFSKPLQFLFHQKNSIFQAKNKWHSKVSFSFGRNQEQMIENIFDHPMNVVFGPPGTGKSVSAASLAINAALQGKSVLITSRTEEALDVVEQKLKTTFNADQFIYRMGMGNNRDKFKIQLSEQDLLFKQIDQFENLKGIEQSIQMINEINDEISQKKEILFEILKGEKDRAHYMLSGAKNWFHKWIMEYKMNQISRTESLIKLIDLIQEKTSQLKKAEQAYVQNKLFGILQTYGLRNQQERQSFFKATRANSAQKKKSYLRNVDFDRMLSNMNIWLIRAQDIGRYFPMKKELFDLVIVDEATQSDIASMLPALQRGKHAILMGDLQQLRHISFLSKKREDQLKESYFGQEQVPIYPYRSHSILDFAYKSLEKTNAIFYLWEHYRSDSSIINFSNNTYYQNDIKPMKANMDVADRNTIILERIPGRRSAGGVNEAEINWIIQHIKTSIEKGTSDTIGIVSPFKNQVIRLRSAVNKQIDRLDVKRLRLKIDTPYGFQGDERDVMYISMVIDEQTKTNVTQYLNSPGVFNVMITRAKKKQILVYSLGYEQLKEENIFRKYLTFEHTPVLSLEPEYQDSFLLEVLEFLEGLGIKNIIKNRFVGEVLFDVTFQYLGKDYIIDLVGFPGLQQDYLALEYHYLINRMGAKLIIIPYSQWISNGMMVRSHIKEALYQIEG